MWILNCVGSPCYTIPRKIGKIGIGVQKIQCQTMWSKWHNMRDCEWWMVNDNACASEWVKETEDEWLTEIKYYIVCTQIAPVSLQLLWKQPSKNYRRVCTATIRMTLKTLNLRTRTDTWTVCRLRCTKCIDGEMRMRLAITAAQGRANALTE